MRSITLLLGCICLFLYSCGQSKDPKISVSSDNGNKYSNNKVLMSNEFVYNDLVTPVKKVDVGAPAVIVYDPDGMLYSFDLGTNQINWSTTCSDTSLHTTGNNKLYIENGTVWVPFQNGEVYAVNGVTGKAFWKTSIGDKKEKRTLRGQVPQVYDNMIYLASRNYNIYALNALNGRCVWNYKLDYPYNHIPTLAFNGVAFTQNAPYVYNFDAKTGKALYQRGFKRAMYGKPVTDGKNLIIANESDTLYCMKPDNLDILWTFVPDGKQYIGEELFCRGTEVYVYSVRSVDNNNPSVYSVNTATGKTTWRTEIKNKRILFIDGYDDKIFGYTESGLLFELELFTGKLIAQKQLTHIPLSNLEFADNDRILYYAKEGLVQYTISSQTETILLKNEKTLKNDDCSIRMLK